jgi:hypothetical protein
MSGEGLALNVFQGAEGMRLVRLGGGGAPPHSFVLQKQGEGGFSLGPKFQAGSGGRHLLGYDPLHSLN